MNIKSSEPISLENLSQKEEFLNAWTHGIACFLALIGTFFLIQYKSELSTHQIAYLLLYGLSMCFLFLASTLYHSAKKTNSRFFLKKVDHIAIYYLIAGTYTPFLALFIPTHKAKVLLIVLWVIAILGTIFKIFLVNRFEKLSLLAYLLMGWMALFVIKDMMHYLPTYSLYALVIGGLFYSIGCIFYAIERIPYNHVIWHFFVNLGATSHFVAVWLALKS